jgi:5-formyltetrahydrofolate cyclo-ligase
MQAETKDEARRLAAQLRRERVPGRDRAKDAESLELAALEVAYAAGLARGDWVATFESTRLEPPTEALIAAFEARGIRVMVPVTLPDWDLDWREAGAGDDAQPLGRSAIGQAAVVFVPAHVVDRGGARLGRGKGCYDRVLPRTRGLVVAVVHPWELVDGPLPAEPHDRRVDAVITAETGVVDLRVATTGGPDTAR